MATRSGSKPPPEPVDYIKQRRAAEKEKGRKF